MPTTSINNRYSVRQYLPKTVEREKIEEIIEAATLAPSSCNNQPWRYIVVDRKEIVYEIFTKGMGTVVSNKWAKTAPVFIVACANKSFFVHNVATAVKQIDYTFLDMGASIENMLLQATALGLGTCWIGWFNEKIIKKMLKIPRNLKIVSLITVGYPANTRDDVIRKRKDVDEILFYNTYVRSG